MATINIGPLRVTGEAGGAPTIGWNVPADHPQSLAQIGAYRVGDRSDAPLTQAAPPPFDYAPVAATGFPNLSYGVVRDPVAAEFRGATPSFTFSGAYPSTGRIPNGTYIIWVHAQAYVRDEDETLIRIDNGVATATIQVTSSPVTEPPRVPRVGLGARTAADPATIITPAVGAPAVGGQVGATFSIPPFISPTFFQVAVYRREDYDTDLLRSERAPVARSDNPDTQPRAGNPDTAAERIPVEALPESTMVGGVEVWTLNFGATSPNEALGTLTGPVPNGEYALVVKYAFEEAGEIIRYDPDRGVIRGPHKFLTSQPAYRIFEVQGSTEPEDVPDPFIYRPTLRPVVVFPRDAINAEVSEPLRLIWHYRHARGIDQESVEIRRVLSGGTNAGTRYLALSGNNLATQRWVTALDTTNDTTTIRARVGGTDLVKGIDLVAGAAADRAWGGLAWGQHNFSVRATSGDGEITEWSDPVRVNVYRRLSILTLTPALDASGFVAVDWTHDGATGNNRQARYRVRLLQDGRFVTGTTDGLADDHARALRGSDLTWTANRSDNSLGPVPNGTYDVEVTIWDPFGNETQDITPVTVNNTLPTAVAVTPRVYDLDGVLQPGTSGLIAGDYVGVAFGAIPTGLHEVRLERREFSRRDGRTLRDEPITRAVLPLGTATSLARFNDLEVSDGVQYEYRAVAASLSGAERPGDWTP